VHQSVDDQVSRMVWLLLARLRGEVDQPQSITLPTRLVLRDSG
jgi:DNA-binding LacI/PurR family transcriptional regulator